MNDPLIVMLLDASVRSAAAVALIALVLAALRVRSSALRHAAWTVTVAAMLLMPLLVMIVPAVAVPAPAIAELVRSPEATPPRPLRGPAKLTDSSSSFSIAQESPRIEGAGPTPQTPAGGANATVLRWPTILVSVYAAGAIVLLIRLAFGCRGLHRLRSSAHPIAALPASTLGGAREIDMSGLLESPRVVSPVTLGFLRPQIVLPDDWRDWPAQKLRLAIFHERAHVARHDPLAALLARLNCCVFWFHPLAWWLERRVAAAAEHACDDEAMRAAATPAEYASVLLDFARTARGAGGRVAWEGIGVSGGRLEGRIDRVLCGRPLARVTVWHRMVVAAGCVAAIFVAVACRQVQEPAPLQTNPEMARLQAFSKEQSAPFEAARKLTWEQAPGLEANWQRNPEDLSTLETLLIFYAPDFSGKPDPNADRKIAARRRLILWLVEHHPEHRLARSMYARIFAEPSEWLRDVEGYEAAKKLWLQHAGKPAVSPETLANAAWFLDVSDKPTAERLLLQGKAADDRPEWSNRVGVLYAQVVLGSSSFTLNNVIRSTDVDLAKSTYAQTVRRKLDDSTDARVLASAGNYLITNAAQAKTDFDRVALGREYLERALKLDPQSGARRGLDYLNGLEESLRRYAPLRGTPRDAWPEAIAKLPDSDRLRMLTRLANDEYMTAESQEWRVKHPDTAADATADAVAKNGDFAQRSFERSKLYARQALDLAGKLPNDPYSPDAVFQANIALGAHAFREGDRKTAVRYMLDASKSPHYRRAPTSLEGRLIGQLLKHGERDTVIEYFERVAQKSVGDDAELPRKAAQAIRDGYWPNNYALGAAQRD